MVDKFSNNKCSSNNNNKMITIHMERAHMIGRQSLPGGSSFIRAIICLSSKRKISKKATDKTLKDHTQWLNHLPHHHQSERLE